MNIERFHTKNLLLLDIAREKGLTMFTSLFISTPGRVHVLGMEFDNDAEKAYNYDIAALVLRKVQGRFYSLCTEAWVVRAAESDPDVLNIRPSQHKDRKTAWVCVTRSKNKILSSLLSDDGTHTTLNEPAMFTGVALEFYTRPINSDFEQAFNQAWPTVRPPYYYEISEDELYKEVEATQ